MLGAAGVALWTVHLLRAPACATPVPGPEPARPLAIVVKPGSDEEWLAVQVLDHGSPLRSVEVRVDGRWRDLRRRADGTWVARDGAGDGPFAFRVTDVREHRKTVEDLDLAPGKVQRTGVFLYGGAVPSPPPSPAPAPAPAAADSQRVTC
ncbi:expansin C-terminal domain-related protein [Nonomuraea typhae]|uniref:expansin C-terminal domain-related protein n=1 Tax=Nonomuraea typhae TaxID=2603600 RepID=UPI001FEA3FA7|nr:expansin C-terminal domain-related protein [Nonomuraea typhae]